MLRCPSCQFENDAYALICTNCRGYLQNRVPNLDLFDTVWGVVESPVSTFRRIALAEHKNYALFLFWGVGIGAAFALMWHHRLGNVFDTIPALLAAGIVGGVVLGPVLALLVPGVAQLVLRLGGVKARFRNSLAALAYSSSPVIVSVLLILPVELAVFGMYMFTWNPSPYALKPVAYVTLIAFDSLLALWAVLLGMVGLKVVHQTSWGKAAASMVAVLALLAGLVWASGSLVGMV